MEKEEKIIKYYVLCNKLKTIIRSGWGKWGVNAERVESVAEHIYGVQMLAIAMQSEYKYDINLERVILMLAVHELEEIIIGDLTPFQISKEEKEKKGHLAVKEILKDLDIGQEIEQIVFEFDAGQTMDAKFARWCDKLECDLQCKLYDESNCVDLNKQEHNEVMQDELVNKLLNEEKSWSIMWLKYNQIMNSYDENFLKISNFAINNTIKDILKK